MLRDRRLMDEDDGATKDTSYDEEEQVGAEYSSDGPPKKHKSMVEESSGKAMQSVCEVVVPQCLYWSSALRQLLLSSIPVERG
jgi:hypothetical protein